MNLRLEQKMSWVYLINLVLFLAPLLFVPYPLWHYAAMLVALLAFLWCYFKAYRSISTQMHWPVLGIVLIATAIAPINPGAISFFAFAAFFIGFAYSLRHYLLLMTGLCAIVIALDLSDLILWPYFLLLGLPAILGVSLLGRIEQQRQLRLRREQKSKDEIKQLATMVERERIGRDLHDILGHTLSSIILKADLAEKLLARQQTEAAQQQLTELSTIARDALSQVRQSVSGYKHQGLTAEVAKLLSRLRDAGFQVELHGEIPQLDNRRETTLILALTELVTNIMRHSQGDSCQLSFVVSDQHLQLVLADNGKVTTWQEGNGLTGLRERLSAVGAFLTLQPDPGFSAIIDLPLKELL